MKRERGIVVVSASQNYKNYNSSKGRKWIKEERKGLENYSTFLFYFSISVASTAAAAADVCCY